MVMTGSFKTSQSMFTPMVSLATTALLNTAPSITSTSQPESFASISNTDSLGSALGNNSVAPMMGLMFMAPVIPLAIMPVPVLMSTTPITHPVPTPTHTPTTSNDLQNQMAQQMGMLLQLLLALLSQVLQLSSKTPTNPTSPMAGDQAKFWGDPHFVGFDGEKYDVMGTNGGIYNILSDKDVQYNTRFANWGAPKKDGTQPTVIDQAAIQVGNNEVYFDRSGKAPTVNGKSLSKGETVSLGDGKSVSWDGKELLVNTGEYTIDLAVKQPNKNSGYIDSKVTINKNVNPLADGVAPHGLLGQTADGVEGAHKGINNTNDKKQGGTVIDGTVSDYKVSGLWNNDFKFNQFQASSQQPPSPLELLLNSLISGLVA